MRGIELDRNSRVPLSRQIYGTFRDQIIDGRMSPGEALPSTRELAAYLSVSRNTVCEAYDMLLAEAYVESRQGSPTRVAEGIRLTAGCQPAESAGMAVPGPEAPDPTSRDTENMPGYPPGATVAPPDMAGVPSELPFHFRTGLPDLSRFPTGSWLRLMHRASELLSPPHWGYTSPDGLPQLREEIVSWLFRSRGMKVQPEDLFVTAGATHALHILSDLLYTDPFEILVEDPCHTGMLRTLKSKGFQVHPIPADENGMRTECLRDARAKALYVTPSHQFPLGGILPAGRRAELVRYALRNGAYIIEDDYDSEFRYSGPPVAPLRTMAPDRVVYVGTFSKLLFPALRIGYVILPRELKQRWRYLRTHTDVQNPPFEQAALAEFLHSRKFDRHVGQMRRIYGQRRQVLLQSLESEFGGNHRSWGDATGLHMAVEFPGFHFDKSFTSRCKESGLYIQTVDYHCIIKGRHADKLLLGYGHLSPETIRAGIGVLARVLQEKW